MTREPKRRIKWKRKCYTSEKRLLGEWNKGEITSEYAAKALSALHQLRDEEAYTPDQWEENAHWLGYFQDEEDD